MALQKNILDFLHFDSPTIEQRNALLAMQAFVQTDNSDDVLILCGAAGTGKSSITTALIGYLNEQDVKYKIAAPTGRAARLLGRKSNTFASTIHSMIYNVKSNTESGVVTLTRKVMDLNDRFVFVIDEASMINAEIANNDKSLFKTDNSLLKDLLAYVKSGNKNNKIVFLGDRNQLPPVNEQESLALVPNYLMENYKMKCSLHLLTEVKRQDDGSYILKEATKIREAIDNKMNNVSLNTFKFNNFSGAITHYTREYLSRGYDNSVSIACSHKQNHAFNKYVRERIYGKNADLIKKEDLLIVTKTWCRNNTVLYNGDHVTVENIDMAKVEMVAGLHFVPVRVKAKNIDGSDYEVEDYLLLESIFNPSGSLQTADENKLRGERYTKNKVFRDSGHPSDDRYVGALRLTYGHSITCNKAQGGEWNNVYMNVFLLPSLKYVYTALTRGKVEVRRY